MAKFVEYSQKYRHVKMQRHNGILEVTLHTNGGTLQWGIETQIELGDAFTDIGSDRENRVIILTGAGDEFIGPRRHSSDMTTYKTIDPNITPVAMDTVHWYGKRVIERFLDIEVPMIGALNGPVPRHAELGLMCDIVIASDNVTFEDTAHFHAGSGVPGDGINTVYAMLLGLNRARYMALTGQVLAAEEAKELGLVAELMPREKLLPRAWELAGQLVRKPDLVLRYTRIVLTHPLKKAMDENLMYHLTLESMGGLDKAATLGLKEKK